MRARTMQQAAAMIHDAPRSNEKRAGGALADGREKYRSYAHGQGVARLPSNGA